MVMVARNHQHLQADLANLAQSGSYGVGTGPVRIEHIPGHHHKTSPLLPGYFTQPVNYLKTGIPQADLLLVIGYPSIGLPKLPIGGVQKGYGHFFLKFPKKR